MNGSIELQVRVDVIGVAGALETISDIEEMSKGNTVNGVVHVNGAVHH